MAITSTLEHNILAEVVAFVFLNTSAPSKTHTLSLHDALPILLATVLHAGGDIEVNSGGELFKAERIGFNNRSEEHTSELQSRFDLVCRLLLEKKKDPRR